MYSDAAKKSKLPWLAAACAVVLVCVLFLAGRPGPSDEDSAASIRAAIEQAALQCYAVEGVYPPNLAYLQDNYGLQINTDDYYVTYDAFASNLAPDVIVTPKHAAKGGAR